MFFGVLGLSGLRILLSHFWPAPFQRPKGKKKFAIFFWPPMGPNPCQTTFYRNRNWKKSIFDRKKIDPKLPRNLLCRARPLQRRAAAERIGAPPNTRQFRKNRKKINVQELHLAAFFCEKRSETVAKHRVTWSKITLFRLAIPKMAGFWKKKVEFSCFLGFWGFPASEFC